MTEHQMLTNKKDIAKWLKAHNVYKFAINDDLTVDTFESVVFPRKKISSLPVKFNEVHGNFFCVGTQLTTLFGCPTKVSSIFDCSFNFITNLDYAPISCDAFVCDTNPITDLTPLKHCRFNHLHCIDLLVKSYRNILDIVKYCKTISVTGSVPGIPCIAEIPGMIQIGIHDGTYNSSYKQDRVPIIRWFDVLQHNDILSFQELLFESGFPQWTKM